MDSRFRGNDRGSGRHSRARWNERTGKPYSRDEIKDVEIKRGVLLLKFSGIWIPAFAGMTAWGVILRKFSGIWIPAFAGQKLSDIAQRFRFDLPIIRKI